MHDPLHIEIQVGRIVPALCFVFANKGVGVLLFFEVADKTDVLRHSWPIAGLLSIRQGADATDTSCQYLALNLSKRARSNGNRVGMVFIKVDDFGLWVHRVVPFFSFVWTCRQESIINNRGRVGKNCNSLSKSQSEQPSLLNRSYGQALPLACSRLIEYRKDGRRQG